MKVEIIPYSKLQSYGITVERIVSGRQRIIYARNADDIYTSLPLVKVKIKYKNKYYRLVHASHFKSAIPASSEYTHDYMIFCDANVVDDI